MNVNEVIANRAHVLAGNQLGDGGKTLTPNDDVNKSQSSNDTFPTGMHIAVYKKIMETTLPGISELRDTLDQKAKAFQSVVKIGRTHLMDATPVTLGQEFSGYASLIKERTNDIQNALDNVRKLAIGGTAVGTGINAPENFGSDVSKELEESLQTSFQEVENHFTRQGAREEIVQLSGSLKSLAVSLNKIANDIRWMGSGPVSGLGELKIPALQPGSSIMPGKVNPVIPEMMMQVSAQVIGNDSTITFSSANGNFELNTMLPVMAHNILESISILTTGTKTFTEKLIVGLEANTEKLDENIQKNSILVTALVPKLGYDTAAEIAKEADATNNTIKKVLLEKALLSEDEIDNLLDIEKLI
jgi:fumarate hydratase class II